MDGIHICDWGDLTRNCKAREENNMSNRWRESLKVTRPVSVVQRIYDTEIYHVAQL